MKTFLPLKQSILKTMMFICIIFAAGVNAQAQSNELMFENSSLSSGTAGEDDAVYLFPAVNSNLDALVKITGRSSNLVKLTNIDISNTGFSKAFQPQIEYNDGHVSGSKSWWMEFEISFVNANSFTGATISQAYATALDIDGNDDRLREWDAFYGSNSYTMENNSPLITSTLLGILGQLNLLGTKFLGTLTDHAGIDTSATSLMTTHYYQNKNSITIRFGAQTNGSTDGASRQYSVWFKNFTYNAPISTLPVKLTSFTATLNAKKVDLKWSTATEMNVSHFVVERSTDGQNFSDAGIVFANGNTTSNTNYSLSDNISNTLANVIYYRLRSVDIDGKDQVSETRVIRTTKEGNTISIVSYPNPVSNELRITIPADWQNKKVAYELFNLSGQAVRRTESASSSQTENLNVSSLAPGFYMVKVSCEGQTAQQKIVKQ